MALITCPECKKEISDKAEVCIHCGFPIQKHLEETISQVDSKNTRYEIILKTIGPNRQDVIDLLIKYGYSKTNANHVCDELPKKIERHLSTEKAKTMETEFKEIGAVVELVSYEVKTTIPCPGCGKEISKEAYDCPHCGHSIKKRPSDTNYFAIICCVIAAIIIMSFL